MYICIYMNVYTYIYLYICYLRLTRLVRHPYPCRSPPRVQGYALTQNTCILLASALTHS